MTECGEVQPLLAELAIGAAAGQERALALEHVAGCLGCRRELDRLAEAVDGVLLLAPPREPPAGFESRVLAQLVPMPQVRRRRAFWRPGRLVLAAGVAAALVLAFVLGAGLVRRQTADDRALADRYRETLAVADGRYLRAVRLTGAAGD